MTLPAFPEFTEADLSLKNVVEDILLRSPLRASEYTFTNLFAFRLAYDFRLSLLNGTLLIKSAKEPVSFFSPVGDMKIDETMVEMFSYLKRHSTAPYIERVPEEIMREYPDKSDIFIAEEDRKNFDYLYKVQELIELRGRRFHEKKNNVNKFRAAHGYEYLSLTPDLIGECLEFEHYWCEVKECGKIPGLERERCAILEMLNNFESLNIMGGVIKTDGKIAALTLGEIFLGDTMVIHIEKANQHISGLYQVINQEFLIHEAADCTYVNREQDLGIAGLRKSKMSYNPVGFVKKYIVREKI
jgi:hypothetical protein